MIDATVINELREFISGDINSWKMNVKVKNGNDDSPCMEIVFGTNNGSDWCCNTDEYHFTGGFKNWALILICPDSTVDDIINNILKQWRELLC